jgi:hypothetical protein
MAGPPDNEDYRVDSWADVEHCVYHALMDPPHENVTHRICHVVGRLAAHLVDKELITIDEIEDLLFTSRR